VTFLYMVMAVRGEKEVGRIVFVRIICNKKPEWHDNALMRPRISKYQYNFSKSHHRNISSLLFQRYFFNSLIIHQVKMFVAAKCSFQVLHQI